MIIPPQPAQQFLTGDGDEEPLLILNLTILFQIRVLMPNNQLFMQSACRPSEKDEGETHPQLNNHRDNVFS